MRPLVLAVLAACAATRSAPPARAVPAAVQWEGWTRQAFEHAAREDRLILVDVEAGWCHWCHEMDARTYAHPRVAALLVREFVTIRVDADRRPDLAERYRRWGWPATAILTPAARPVLERRGFVPPDEMIALLGRLVAAHRAGRTLERAAPPAASPPPSDLREALALGRRLLDARWDPVATGWNRPQKYPWPGPIEEALLRAHLDGATELRTRALATLDRELGLVDRVDGGMFQYSTGGRWDAPHFEKIAAVQAGAIESFVAAFVATGETRWLEAARAVERYCIERLSSPAGAFWSSQDADVVDAITGARVPGARFYAADAPTRRRLGTPRIDRHVYAEHNGQLVQALVSLHAATGDAAPLAHAERAAAAILARHLVAPGRFTHAADEGTAALRHLGDQIAMGRALLALHAATGRPGSLDRARAVGDAVLSDLLDRETGALFAHTADPAAVGVFAERRRPFLENARAARFFAALGAATDEPRWTEAATAIVRALAPEAPREGVYVADWVMALAELGARRFHLTVVGRDEPATRALHRAALALAEPRKVVSRSTPGERYPDLGRPAAYLCDARACSSPVFDPARLADEARAFLADDDGS